MLTEQQIQDQQNYERKQIQGGLDKLRTNTTKLEEKTYASATVYGSACVSSILPDLIAFIDSIKELEHLRNNIKWDKFVIHTPIYDLYKESDHYQYRIFQDPRFMSPMPSFHIDFYIEHIAPILDTYFTTINFDIDKLKEYCVEITNKIYYEYNNVH